jgi:catechol 2,3-dioxygenase-like lactoylglutathione lyase family enzyme
MLAQLKSKNVQIATPGGKAVTLADGTRSVLIRDLDQRFVELRQPATPPAGDGAFAEVRIAIAVNDMDRTKQIYRDVLGFKVEGETTFTADKGTQQLTGLSKAEVRRSRVQAPGSNEWIELVEYKGVDRTPLHMKIQDRGAARLQVRVQNIDPLVSAVKAAGLSVHTTGGLPVPIPPNFRAALIADPNNFFLTFFEPCDNCAPRLRPATQ